MFKLSTQLSGTKLFILLMVYDTHKNIFSDSVTMLYVNLSRQIKCLHVSNVCVSGEISTEFKTQGIKISGEEKKHTNELMRCFPQSNRTAENGINGQTVTRLFN